MKATTALKGPIIQKNLPELQFFFTLHDDYELEILQSVLLSIDSAVYLTPQKRFHIRISPRIFGKKQNCPRVPQMGPGKVI